MGEEYVVATNFVALCMNVPWACLDAVSTAAHVDVAKKRLNYRASVKVAYLYASLLLIIAFVMFFGLFRTYNVSFQIGIIYFCFQLYDYFTWTLLDILYAHTQLGFSAAFNTGLDLSSKIVRVLLATMIASPYCMNIASVGNAIVSTVGYMIVRFVFFKTENGVLVRKEKRISPKKKTL